MRSEKIDLLDHGYIRLIASMGNDLSIVRNARNEYDASWREGLETKSDAYLINFLMENRHSTPFESVEAQFEVKAPIFVFRQWHRHRTQSYNEISARYSELPEEFYVPAAEHLGEQSSTNKQARTMVDGVREDAEYIMALIRTHMKISFTQYRNLLDMGVPRELARSVLPVATYSRMSAKANLHNWFHFLGLRMNDHAQYEIRVYAEEIFKILYTICPNAVAAFWEHGLKRRPGALERYLADG